MKEDRNRLFSRRGRVNSGGIMSTSTRRPIWLLLVPLPLVAVLGLLVLWGLRSFSALPQVSYDTPTQLASISVPGRPNSLAWSADGSYLAAGTFGPGEVYVADVAKASVLTTLKTKSWVEGLAFSPDGKWLAVAARPSVPAGGAPAEPAELVVFDVPAFTARLTAKAGSPENGFIDLAWAADSKSLCAIDGPVFNAQGKAEVRRWDMPAFTEQPVVRALQLKGDAALAVSPDGHTLALAFGEGETNQSLVRLFDLGGGAERSSFRADNPYQPPRLGFTADGKAVGVFDTNRLAWWDVATGRPAEPRAARFAVQPAGLSGHRARASVSPDGGWVAQGYDRHRGLGDLGWDNRGEEYGGFVKVTESAPAKARTWRVSRAQDAPVVAFSPDGTRLAGTVRQPSGGAILIWAVPK
jgi:WD domain, G-beta repeat/WD40-like Beta Propeller Repeat